MHRIRLLALVLAASGSMLVPLAHAASPDAVISQVYAGGGNVGASYANDFVELFNRGGTAVDLTGWTIQYASAASTSWQATASAGSLAPGRHYLVQLAVDGGRRLRPADPDATGTTNLAASGGKVALVEAPPRRRVARRQAVCGCGCRPDRLRDGRRRQALQVRGADSTTADLRATPLCADMAPAATDRVAPTRNSTAPASPCCGVRRSSRPRQQPPHRPGSSGALGVERTTLSRPHRGAESRCRCGHRFGDDNVPLRRR